MRKCMHFTLTTSAFCWSFVGN